MSQPMPWECPRCNRINAPFTPFCSCEPPGAEPTKPLAAMGEYQEALRDMATQGFPLAPTGPTRTFVAPPPKWWSWTGQ